MDIVCDMNMIFQSGEQKYSQIDSAPAFQGDMLKRRQEDQIK